MKKYIKILPLVAAAVIGLPVHPLMKTPEALKVVGPQAFGYPDLVFQPLQLKG
jgi:DUF917 family protein